MVKKASCPDSTHQSMYLMSITVVYKFEMRILKDSEQLKYPIWAAFIDKSVYFGLLLIRSREDVRRDKKYFLKVFCEH